MHIHVRNPDESPGSEPELYAQVQDGVRKHCPGMIVQFSTGGRGREQEKRGAMLYLEPDMASLATGSVNFPTGIYEIRRTSSKGSRKTMLDHGIKPEIEVFDLAMLYNAANLVKKGLVKERPHVQFVLGVPNAMPARRVGVRFPARRARGRAAGRHVGRRRCRPASMGGQPVVPRARRTLPHGTRGQPAHRADRLAASNAELVRKIVDECARYDRRPASSVEARQMLGLARPH